ncbi:MAG: sugar kinase [Bacteroidetes bacterium HGW-Bacteroidetes-3]|nr:MAG: sugar kinase [Bacteroidetes bacterium HGW-Bacteroidetes-3]
MTYKSIVGVWLGGRTLVAGKVKDGKTENTITKQINNLASEEQIISEVVNIIDKVMDDDVVGIGIGVPSLVDVEKGIVYRVQKIPSWREVHLKDILESRFNVKVYVNNDANCFAVGEKYFGTAKDYENIVGLILGSGVGAGIVFKGHLYSGTNCGAGEFGSLPYRNHDFEYYCSEGYFEEKYGINADVLYQRALQKDKIALAIYEQYGQDVGNVIKAIMFAADPEIIVIGGSMAKAFPFFENEMNRIVKTFTYKHILNKLKIIKSENEDIAILGAAALFYDAQNMTMKKY